MLDTPPSVSVCPPHTLTHLLQPSKSQADPTRHALLSLPLCMYTAWLISLSFSCQLQTATSSRKPSRDPRAGSGASCALVSKSLVVLQSLALTAHVVIASISYARLAAPGQEGPESSLQLYPQGLTPHWTESQCTKKCLKEEHL